MSSAASCAASGVLPLPPGPMIVSRRVYASRPCSSSSSASRPTKLVAPLGRLFGAASSERNGAAPGSPSANTRSGSERSRSRWTPRSCSAAPGGSAAAAAADTSVCPGRPISHSRRARAVPVHPRSARWTATTACGCARRRASTDASASAPVVAVPAGPPSAATNHSAAAIEGWTRSAATSGSLPSASPVPFRGHLADVPARRSRDRARQSPTTSKEPIMTKLIADMSMSLDGRVASLDDDISRLARWFFDGDVEVAPGAPFRTSENSAKLLREALGSVGAIIGGRRYFDLADGWGGRHAMGVPVYILTHEPPADWPADSTIHFVTDGLESAVAQAREAAAGKDIGIATPGVVRQCLDAGLLDGLQVNLIPVVLGEGLPFFDGIVREVELEGPEVIEGTGVTHLRYTIAESGPTADPAAEAVAAHVAQA